VTTVRAKISDLVKAYFAANRSTELDASGNLDFRAYARVQYTIDPSNTDAIAIGDHTVTYNAATPSQGRVFPSGDIGGGYYNQSYTDIKSVDITLDWAVAASGTQYLNVSAYR